MAISSLLSLPTPKEINRKSRPFRTQAQEFPWLMLPQKGEDSQNFLDFSTNDCLPVEVPESRGKRICGSSRGWLVMVGENLDLSLSNPLIRRSKIQLPPVCSLIDEEERCGQGSSHTLSSMFIHKAVLVSKPDENLEGYTVMVIYGKFRKLAIFSSGNETWTSLQDAGSFYDDAVLCDDTLYAVNDCGKIILIWEPSGTPMVQEMVPPWFFQGNKVYLVEIEEELFLVIRYLEESLEFGYRTSHFKVYEVDFHLKLHDRIKGIAEWAIFLGNNQSIALSTLRVEGLRENCIYFSDDYEKGYEDGVLAGHDSGVFNLEEKIIEPLAFGQDDSAFIWPPPIWFTPEF